MALTKIQAGSFAPGAIRTEDLSSNTTAAFATSASVAEFATSLAPKVTTVNVANSSFAVLDDTAVNVGGGYIVITGANFAEGAIVLIDTTPASSVARISSTTLRVQVPAKPAASYNLFVVNPDGGTGIRVNGITYSGTPTWVTGSPLAEQVKDTAFTINLNATSATSYALAAGSSLPAGTTLLANGYFYGTVTVETATTYSFDVVATDAENQDSSKTFSVTVSVSEPYFKYTTLLIQADDVSNNTTNSTFVDSSNNNLVISSTSGTVAQGSFNPFGTGWSNHFNGSSDYLNVQYNSAFDFISSTTFTMEAWIYIESGAGSYIISTYNSVANQGWAWTVGPTEMNYGATWNGASNYVNYNTTGTISLNRWHHVAMVKNGTTVTAYVDGVSIGTRTGFTGSWAQGSKAEIGSSGSTSYPSWWSGYISNFRIVKGTALYSSNFTPSTAPLTNVANTMLLTCKTNSFKDESTNAFVVTNGSTADVQRFSPFDNKNAPYNLSSANTTYGGSLYFDGSSYLNIENAADFNPGSNNFTIECYIYSTVASTEQQFFAKRATDAVYAPYILGIKSNRLYFLGSTTGSSWNINSGTATGSINIPPNAWTHIAIVRNGTTVTGYVNGVADVTYTSVSGSLMTNSANVSIGSTAANGGNSLFTGYISDLRVQIGTATYTSNFTPPTTPLQPITDTKLLMKGNNAKIYDATMQNNIKVFGNAQVSTAVSKYGTGSIYFDGTGDYLSMPHNPNIDLLGSNFTIEAWVYYISRVANSGIIFKGGATYGLLLYNDSDGRLTFYATQSGSSWAVTNLIVSNLPSTGAWHHVAVTRSGNVYRTFFNGTLANSTTVAGNLLSYPTGSLFVGNYTTQHNGYIDDLRITKGYARYTDSFTPPTKLIGL